MEPLSIIASVVAVCFGVIGGYVIRDKQSRAGLGKAERKAEEIERKAEREAREKKEDADRAIRAQEKEMYESIRAKENHLSITQERLIKQQDSIEKQAVLIREREEEIRRATLEIEEQRQSIRKLIESQSQKLEQIANLSPTAAKEELIRQAREKHQEDLAMTLQKMFKERKDEIEKKGLEIMVTALQRYARSHVAEATTSFFPLKDEDLKGKIIGREGRNIKAIERATGVELIIDETPDSIMISSFDPFRREIAYMALEKLLKDGRIQPAKIEEKVEEARQELEVRMHQIGEAAANEVGVFDLPKELITLLGRLHFRTSFGQNVLTHSIEMAHIVAMIAAELKLNVAVAKKGALLHDIGKAIDHDVEGTHVDLGRKLLKKYGIDEAVIWAMQSHHDDYPYASPESYVVTAADILSAGRPGARRGTVENYIRRLADLERIASEFPGVRQSYAVNAGRELRIFVIPEKIDDFRALELAREVANKIQSELKYPGEIKVNVIRELRAVEYAR
jgi:ribonuclease Y